MHFENKILITGAKGMVGSALVRKLTRQGYKFLLTPIHNELELCKEQDVFDYFEKHRPEYVFHAAGKVGGIVANQSFPADFFFQNAQMGINLLKVSQEFAVKKLLNLGSSCIYPKLASQPITEDQLFCGPYEKTNEGYAVALCAVLKYAEFLREQKGADFVTAMPSNLYGEGDNFHPEHSHVIPALLRRFHEAKKLGKKEIVIWGSGKPLREFLYIDDLADAIICIMHNYSEKEIINVGSPNEVSIEELVYLIKDIVSYDVKIHFDHSKPDGAPRKKLDTKKLDKLGWYPKVNLRDGLKRSYDWAIQQEKF